MPNDNLKKLHSNLTNKWKGFTIPYNQFETDMQDTNNLKKLHNNLTEKWDGFTIPYEQFQTDIGLKKKEETVSRDFSKLGEMVGAGFESRGKAIKKQAEEKARREHPKKLISIVEENPQNFDEEYKREAFGEELIKKGYTPEEAEESKELAKTTSENKILNTSTSKAKTYLRYVSGYGRDASAKKVANATEEQIDKWTTDMLKQGIDEGGINQAIAEIKNNILSVKGDAEADIYDKATQKEAYKRVKQDAHEFERVTQEQVDAEKDEMLKSKLRTYLPENLKIQAGIEDKVSVILDELKEKKLSGTLTTAERDKLERKLAGLELLRNDKNYTDRLFNPVTGELLGREEATQSSLDYEADVEQQMSKLTDKEKTLSYVKKAMHRVEALENEMDYTVSLRKHDGSGFEELTYKEALENYKPILESALSKDLIRVRKEARAIKGNWIKAKSQFDAVNRAYMTNTDPAQVDKGYWNTVGEKAVEATGQSGAATMTDSNNKFVNEYVSLMNELGSYVTPEQRETAKITFKEKLADATVQSAEIAGQIAISALVTRNLGAIVGVGSKLGKLKT